MTTKQILDAFSETLMQDERILSPRERELLMSLLQNAKDASGNPETQSAVTAAIARSVGETVAQRAFALLGSSIVEQIVARSVSSGRHRRRHSRNCIWWPEASRHRTSTAIRTGTARGAAAQATPERTTTAEYQPAPARSDRETRRTARAVRPARHRRRLGRAFDRAGTVRGSG